MRVLLVTSQFRRDQRKLADLVIAAADEQIRRLRADPLDRIAGVKKLVGVKPVMWRVRVGDYRLIYTFTKTTLTLHRIRHRKEVYQRL